MSDSFLEKDFNDNGNDKSCNQSCTGCNTALYVTIDECDGDGSATVLNVSDNSLSAIENTVINLCNDDDDGNDNDNDNDKTLTNSPKKQDHAKVPNGFRSKRIIASTPIANRIAATKDVALSPIVLPTSQDLVGALDLQKLTEVHKTLEAFLASQSVKRKNEEDHDDSPEHKSKKLKSAKENESSNEQRDCRNPPKRKETRWADATVIDTNQQSVPSAEVNLTINKSYYSANQFISDNVNYNNENSFAGLRPIVIDGSNIAMTYSKGRFFSVKALKICIDFFIKRGHRVYAFIPAYRLKRNQTDNQTLLHELVNKQLVYCTASREVFGRKICSYDDRILVQAAAAMRAVIVTNDNYRDLLAEDYRYASVIERGLLMPTWVDDMIIFPQDPLGKNGPTLNRFLRFP